MGKVVLDVFGPVKDKKLSMNCVNNLKKFAKFDMFKCVLGKHKLSCMLDLIWEFLSWMILLQMILKIFHTNDKLFMSRESIVDWLFIGWANYPNRWISGVWFWF